MRIPFRVNRLLPAPEPVFTPIVVLSMFFLLIAVLVRGRRGEVLLEGRVVMKKRPWQNRYLIAMAVVDCLCYLSALGFFAWQLCRESLPFASFGEIFWVIFPRLQFKAILLFCLLYTRRAGFAFALSSPPFCVRAILMMLPQDIYLPIGGALVLFHYYCLFCRRNRLYCCPPKLPSQEGEHDPDAEAAERFTRLSSFLNRHEGLRANAGLGVISGPDPSLLIPPPEPLEAELDAGAADGETAPEEILEGTEEPYDPAVDAAPEWEEARPPLPPEEAAQWKRYRALGRLEPRVFAGALPLEALPEDPPPDLLERCGLWSFLREEGRVARMVRACWREALDDLRGYPAPPRRGTGTGECSLPGKNRLWMVLRVTENPAPPHLAEAELHLNE